MLKKSNTVDLTELIGDILGLAKVDGVQRGSQLHLQVLDHLQRKSAEREW